jgi:hypothetical protein
MNLKNLTQRLIKVAQTLESNNKTVSAAKVRKIADQLGKMVQDTPSEESQKDMLISEIRSKIPGTQIKAKISSAHDIIYYDIEFRSGTKVLVGQTIISPVRTISKQITKKPFTVSLMKLDETTGQEKHISSGVMLGQQELIPYLQKIAVGSQREMAQLFTERRIQATSDMLDSIADRLEAKNLKKLAYEID